MSVIGLTYLQSLQESLHNLFAQDELIYLIGEDLRDPDGGAFKVSRGLSTLHPSRVLNTPISEAAVVGVAIGMALRGLKPIVEIMFGDFLTLATDQIINHLVKFRSMYGNAVRVPLVIRTPMGGRRGYGPTHSQSIEKIFFGVPDLLIVSPSHFHQPGLLLERAIGYGNPVLFIENKILYGTALDLEPIGPLNIEMNEESSGFPTAMVRNYSMGVPDVTVIAYGGVSSLVAQVLLPMAKEEIRILVCMPSQIQPLPIEILSSCAKESRRVVVVEEGTRSFGWGSEVASCLYETVWPQLEAPIVRLGCRDTLIPNARSLEEEVLPSSRDLEDAIYEVLV